MVQEPSHVKQLSPIHVCKIGLKPDEQSERKMETCEHTATSKLVQKYHFLAFLIWMNSAFNGLLLITND
jgi:hypothetical protein